MTATSGTTTARPLLVPLLPLTTSCPSLPTSRCLTLFSPAPTTAPTWVHSFGHSLEQQELRKYKDSSVDARTHTLTKSISYAATARSIPAIALSASNLEVPYNEVKNKTNGATWIAETSIKIVDHIIETSPAGGPILPLGYGVTVNIPPLTASKKNPKIVQTRMTGNAHVNEAVLDPEDGTFTWANIKPYAAGVNACVNGDCSLPGETYVVENGAISISFYTIDYTSPESSYTDSLLTRIAQLTKGNGY